MNEREIFSNALQKETDAERSAYLDEACDSDTEMRHRVEALLNEKDDLGSFLEAPAVATAATIDMPAVTETVGSIIGPYKLMEQIGEGGMGVVYVAQQEKPVRRKVALKIIKPGMDTKQVIARFEAERQALAMMNHPNIAKVLEVGATETGQPYFCMELVRGLPITEYCDKKTLNTRERLELFILVCRAVQHAHQKGIIHRDLKPSNILVTIMEDGPVPKVIDFGVAKATNQQLTEQTLYTAHSQMIGTPLYMSPEQAELSGLDVDTRSDVYSLGVLLYELLTGTTPFDKETLKQAGFDEMRRIIREEEPPRPSDRISTLHAEALSTLSAQRNLDPHKFSHQVQGELDWIVMQALEKDRTRRYESASAFAADIQRFLKDEPVEACPPSSLYRLRKLARRNKVALITTAVVATSLFIGTGVSIWQANVANAARGLAERRQEETEAAREAAQHSADQSKALAEFLVNDVLGSTNPDRKDNWDWDHITVSEVLLRAEKKIANAFPNDPLTEASVCYAIGNTFQDLHLHRSAERLFRRSHFLRTMHLGHVHSETVRSAYELARTRCLLGQFELCRELCRQTLQHAREALGKVHPNIVALTNQLAITSDDPREAQELCRSIAQTLRAQDANDYDAVVLNDAAAFLTTTPSATREDLELAIDLVQRAIAKDPGQRDFSRTLAIVEYCRGRSENAIEILLRIKEKGNGVIRLNPAVIPAFRFSRETKLLEELLTRQLTKNQIPPSLHMMRAHLYGRARQWEKAAGDLREEIRLHQNRVNPWALLSWVHFQTGDVPGCRRMCLEVSDRFGRGSRYTTLMCQVFLPDVIEDYSEVLEFSFLIHSQQSHHGMSRAMHGLVLYRAGQFTECLQWLDVDELTRDLIRENPDNPYPAIMSVLTIAMVHEKLGHEAESRNALKAGTQLLEARSRRADLGDQWHQWIRCNMLRDEAEKLLGIPAVTQKPKLEQTEN